MLTPLEVPSSLRIELTDEIIREAIELNKGKAGQGAAHCATCLVATALEHYYPVEGHFWLTKANLSTLVKGVASEDAIMEQRNWVDPAWAHEEKTSRLIQYYDGIVLKIESPVDYSPSEVFTMVRNNANSRGIHVLARLF